MTRFQKSSLLVFIVLFSLAASAQDMTKGYEPLLTPVYKYSIYKTISSIKIDGNADETSWQNAEWSEDFVFLKGNEKADSTYRTRFKMLWDNKNLYLFVEMKDPHIWTNSVDENGIYYPGNGLAVLIDPSRTTHQFVEFDVNAQNQVNSQYFKLPPRHGGMERKDWQVRGIKSAVVVKGTLNNPVDVDEKWVVEMSVPIKSLSWYNDLQPPKNNTFWKLNFLRLQWPTKIVNGSYRKELTNPGKKITRGIENYLYATNLVWSPHGVDNVLYPERWGLVRFSYDKVSVEKEEFPLPDEEIYGRYLWLIYYKQQEYSRVNGYYATSLSNLGIPQLITMDTGEKIYLKMETRGSSFYVTLENKKGLKISVNQDGYFQIVEEASH